MLRADKAETTKRSEGYREGKSTAWAAKGGEVMGVPRGGAGKDRSATNIPLPVQKLARRGEEEGYNHSQNHRTGGVISGIHLDPKGSLTQVGLQGMGTRQHSQSPPWGNHGRHVVEGVVA